jgi:hypothetical protein
MDYHNTNRFIVSNFTHEDQEKVFDKVDKPCYITIWRNVRDETTFELVVRVAVQSREL